MAVILRSDLANTTALPALQRAGEREDRGIRKVRYDNLDQSGVTLATAKLVELGLLIPKDRARGQILTTYLYREPLADRADGTPRHLLFTGIGYIPADATPTERGLGRARFADVVGSGDAYTITSNLIVIGL